MIIVHILSQRTVSVNGQLNSSRPRGNHVQRFGCQGQILVVSDDWTPVNFEPCLCTGKSVVPHPTQEIGMDHFLGFEVDQRLARRGGSRQCRHIWARRTLLSQLSAGTLLSEQHSRSSGCDQCRMLSDILLHSTPLSVLVVTCLQPSSCESQATSASGRKECYERKLFCCQIG